MNTIDSFREGAEAILSQTQIQFQFITICCLLQLTIIKMLTQQNQTQLPQFLITYPHITKQSVAKTRQNYDFSDSEQDYDQPSGFVFENGLFSNPIDFLAAQSLQTIHRESLQIVPEIAFMEYPNQTQTDSGQGLKTSRNSLLNDDKENESEMEENLIIQTSELTLESSISSIAEQLCCEGPASYLKGSIKNKKQKLHYLKSAKQLIRSLRREWRQNESVMGDGFLKTSKYSINIKEAIFQSVMSQKGHLAGFIINHKQNLLKIKVENNEDQYFDPKLEIWDELEKSWEQFCFKIKLYSI